MESSPWICHICNHKGLGESVACAQCFQVTCPAHLTHKSVFNRETGLYGLQPVCMACSVAGLVH